jgi:transposase
MNYNQNEKIAQITSQTLIIGVDIAKFKHVARAQDYRGIEFGSPCYFENTKQGFQYFLEWISQLKQEQSMEKVMVGMEPTGHYWLNLAHILKENEMKFVAVNPLHVKKSKELDDNSPTKNDVKEPESLHSWSRMGDTPNLRFHKGFMQNSAWRRKFVIYSPLTYKRSKAKSTTG